MSITPDNYKGKATDLQFSVTLADNDAACRCFDRATKRLQNPPVWHELCGTFSASFTLKANDDHDANRLVKVTDRFKIEIPGPGNAAGGGYDWVIVEAIEDNSDPAADQEKFGMRLRADNDAERKKSHFFTADATSSFEIIRRGTTVTAFYHGRNEVANTDTGSVMNDIRNSAIATGGIIGLSEAQWSALLKGLLQDEIGG